VPVKAAESVLNILKSSKNKDIQFQVLSNPEFLAEGTSVADLLNPDRILIGGDQETEEGRYAIEQLASIYQIG
jgi:UDPglucose 6-dehydrogenase